MIFNASYAGIGPANIDSMLQKISNELVVPEGHKAVWIDMESSLRTIIVSNEAMKDVFDVNKAMICILAAVEAGMPQYSPQGESSSTNEHAILDAHRITG